jgi:hypothetical protein
VFELFQAPVFLFVNEFIADLTGTYFHDKIALLLAENRPTTRRLYHFASSFVAQPNKKQEL